MFILLLCTISVSEVVSDSVKEYICRLTCISYIPDIRGKLSMRIRFVTMSAMLQKCMA